MPGYGRFSIGANMTHQDFSKSSYVAVRGHVTSTPLPPSWMWGMREGRTLVAIDVEDAHQPVWILTDGAHPSDGEDVSYRGRLFVQRNTNENLDGTTEDFWFLFVDTSYGRISPESVAGQVVGAMGLMILGLYLRRWLRARKAFAGESPEGMIA